MRTKEQALAALEALDYSRAEAEVYVSLLRSGRSSGYRIAQLVGRPDSNVYKSLKNLSDRGIVLETSGTPTLYSAMPFDEVSAAMQSDLRDRTRRAESMLRGTPRDSHGDWAIYKLATFEQVAAKVRSMVEHAKNSVLLDAPAALLEDFRDCFEAAAKRKIVVLAKTYQPIQMRGVAVAFSARSIEVFQQWDADWLNVVCDGRATLLSLFARDESRRVLQGSWTESPYFSWILHSALWSEISLAALESARESKPGQTLAAALDKLVPFPSP